MSVCSVRASNEDGFKHQMRFLFHLYCSFSCWTWRGQAVSCARCFLLVYIMYKPHTRIQQVDRQVGFTAETLSQTEPHSWDIFISAIKYIDSSIKLTNVGWEFGILGKTVMLAVDMLEMVSNHSFPQHWLWLLLTHTFPYLLTWPHAVSSQQLWTHRCQVSYLVNCLNLRLSGVYKKTTWGILSCRLHARPVRG